MKKIKKAINIKLMLTKLASMLCTIAMLMNGMCITAFAAEEAPADVQTGTMSSMVDIVFWVVRIFILIAGGAPGIMKIVQGQADENPRDRNNGLVLLVITGAAFGATFAVKNFII